MLARQVFPDYSVKQAFRELNIERNDDAVVSSIQEKLLTRCIVDIIKSAMVQCINGKRKYISAVDIQGALSVSRIPRSHVISQDKGYLLDTRHLGTMITQHLDMLGQLLDRFDGSFESSLKFSAETLIVIQEAVEQSLRGFMVYYAQQGRATCAYDDHLFHCCLANIFGDPHDEVG